MRPNLKPSLTQLCRGQTHAPDFFIPRCLGNCLVTLVCMSILLIPFGVHGQSEDSLLVQAPNTKSFPQITVQFELPESVDFSGEELQASQVQVLENGREVPIEALQREKRGVLFTLAINGGRDFDLRDADGLSNFDKLRTSLEEWASHTIPVEGDAWSLIDQGESMVINRTSDEWRTALGAYNADFRTMTPNLESLKTAIRFTDSWTVPFGVDKAVLYITMPPKAEEIKEIKALEEQARKAEILVNVWMLGEPLYLNNDQGGALISLAEGTGGKFFHFTGIETLPDPRTLFSPLGQIYTLQYESLIRQTGTYPLQIQVSHQDRIYEGESPSFYVDIRPPEAVLIDPPGNVTRAVADEGEITSGAFIIQDLQAVLYPDLQPVKFQTSFPDGHSRPIIASQLLVNGVVVAMKEAPPFNSITWNLSEVVEPGEYLIQVEVTDSLGLSGRTAEYPVQISVALPEAVPKPTPLQISLVIGGILLGLSILSVLAWLIFRWRKKLNLKQFKGVLAKRASRLADHGEYLSGNPKTFYASLLPTGRLEEDWEARTIRITKRDGVFGVQPSRADFLVQGEGLDEVQARLKLNKEGFWLQDLDSRLGTWVNYRRIGRKPVKIQPGDLIHFGNIGFRFTMVNNSLPDKVRIEPYEPIL